MPFSGTKFNYCFFLLFHPSRLKLNCNSFVCLSTICSKYGIEISSLKMSLMKTLLPIYKYVITAMAAGALSPLRQVTFLNYFPTATIIIIWRVILFGIRYQYNYYCLYKITCIVMLVSYALRLLSLCLCCFNLFDNLDLNL